MHASEKKETRDYCCTKVPRKAIGRCSRPVTGERSEHPLHRLVCAEECVPAGDGITALHCMIQLVTESAGHRASNRTDGSLEWNGFETPFRHTYVNRTLGSHQPRDASNWRHHSIAPTCAQSTAMVRTRLQITVCTSVAQICTVAAGLHWSVPQQT